MVNSSPSVKKGFAVTLILNLFPLTSVSVILIGILPTLEGASVFIFLSFTSVNSNEFRFIRLQYLFSL